MGKNRRGRLIWEEILEEPFVYRICEAGRRENAYLIVSGDEALAVDPRSAQMLRSINMLSRGLGAAEGRLKLFLTAGCTDERMRLMYRTLPPQTVIYSALSPCEKPESGTEDGETDACLVQVFDGSPIPLGSSMLKCIQTEGCSRGLMSLWMEREGILFCGDAVGCDYLPPVQMWDSRIDTLGLQIETLRRLRSMPVQMILPGHGAPAGVEDLPDACTEPPAAQTEPSSSKKPGSERSLRKRGLSPVCAAVLDDTLMKYCIHILEVYQRVPSRGSILVEKMEQEGENGASSVLSCCKYLLYRKYIRCKKDEEGQAVYERGSILLTDWGMQNASL